LIAGNLLDNMMFNSLIALLTITVMTCLCSCSKQDKDKDKHEEMMESSFELSPALRTTLNKLQSDIDKWEQEKKEFIGRWDVAKTLGGRAAAQAKLSKIESILTNLKDNYQRVLEQAEIIAIESEGTHTKLDKIALNDLDDRAKSAMRDASELREALSSEPGADAERDEDVPNTRSTKPRHKILQGPLKERVARLKGELAGVEQEIESERVRWKNALAVINKLTNFKRTPVRQGSQEYYKCLAASKIIKEIEARAPALKAEKAKLKAMIKSLEDS